MDKERFNIQWTGTVEGYILYSINGKTPSRYFPTLQSAKETNPTALVLSQAIEWDLYVRQQKQEVSR